MRFPVRGEACRGLSPGVATQGVGSLNFLKAPKAYADPRSYEGKKMRL